MKALDVFTPNKLPSVTYVEDRLIERKELLLDAMEMGATLISLSGPSKSGKTVFIEKIIGKDKLLQVSGAGITEAKILWDRILDLIGVPISLRKTQQTGFKADTSGKIKGDLWIVKGEMGVGGEKNKSESATEEYALDYLQLVIRELSGTKLVIFIDDFHYIPKDVQVFISNQIKEAISNEVSFICASVPYRSDDIIRANPDLRGRLVKIDFNYWGQDELRKIAKKGFAALNVNLSDAMINALVSEAAGSPQLMQSLCLKACYEIKARERKEVLINIRPRLKLVEKICQMTANMTDYSSTVEKMKDGPRLSDKNRKTYLLNDDTIADVYKVILLAIALNPPELNIRYNNLKNRIDSVCSRKVPSASSVTNACSHIEKIVNDAENRTVIEWDSENDVLDIRDPYLLFCLRWGV